MFSKTNAQNDTRSILYILSTSYTSLDTTQHNVTRPPALVDTTATTPYVTHMEPPLFGNGG